MRSADEFDQVRQLIATGMNDCAIARLTVYRGRRCAIGAADVGSTAAARRSVGVRHRP